MLPHKDCHTNEQEKRYGPCDVHKAQLAVGAWIVVARRHCPVAFGPLALAGLGLWG